MRPNCQQQDQASELSCPWVNNSWEKKNKKKTVKYAPLSWELKTASFPCLQNKLKQHNIIIDALEEWSQEMDTTMYKIVGSRSKEVLKRMQKAVLSSMLNIARTFEVVTWETIDCIFQWFLLNLALAKFGFDFFCSISLRQALFFVIFFSLKENVHRYRYFLLDFYYYYFYIILIPRLIGSLCTLYSILSCRQSFENFVIIMCELRDDWIVIFVRV